MPVVEDVGWVWRRMLRWDGEAGFRADRRLIHSGDLATRSGFRTLVAISATLLVAMVASAAAGAWLIAGGGGLFPVLGGVALLALAWLMRPRLGRIKRELRDRYKLPATHAPALHELIDRVADATGAPRPQLVTVDFDWNASAMELGYRRTRVLTLGVPLMYALSPQELVGLIAHELGHFAHDGRRTLLTMPACTVFGTLSSALRPPPGDAIDRGFAGVYALVYTLFQLVAGSVSLLLYAVHLAITAVDARDSRRAELRADGMAASAAGTAAALDLADTLALLPELETYVQHHVPEDDPGAHWRRMLATVRERELPSVPWRRQLSIRTGASLLASHPAPGRRHEWLSRQPRSYPRVTLAPEAADRIQVELRPYGRELRRRLADQHPI